MLTDLCGGGTGRSKRWQHKGKSIGRPCNVHCFPSRDTFIERTEVQLIKMPGQLAKTKLYGHPKNEACLFEDITTEENSGLFQYCLEGC